MLLLKEHYVSKLHYAWPQVECISGFPARGSTCIFASYRDHMGEELLDLRQKRRTGTQLVNELRKQADDARSYTMSMPYRVQRIEEFVKELESGELKHRVQVLELERVAKKANILQMATVYTVLGSTLMNIGVTLSSQGNVAFANGSYVGVGDHLLI